MRKRRKKAKRSVKAEVKDPNIIPISELLGPAPPPKKEGKTEAKS